MPLDDTTYINGIIAMRNTLKTYDGTTGKTQSDAISYEANQLCALTKAYIKSGDITGITVSTATPGVQLGSSSAPGTGSQSNTVHIV